MLWFCGVFGRPETNKQWNDTGPNIYLTVSRAIQVLHEWINARNLQQPESTSLNNEDFAWWEPPPSGFLKCNVDASFNTQEKTTSWGVLFQKCQWCVCKC